MQTARLLTLTTGGTIGGNVKAEVDLAGPADQKLTGLDAILAPTIERIKDEYRKEVAIDQKTIADVDSSDILPTHWQALCREIAGNYDDYDGFIVTHGTNTMGYTSAALSFAFENLGKPVVVTGSQVPFGWPGSDALMNLENAVRVASQTAVREIRGVVCVFGSHIITGTRAKKSTEFDYDAFQSFSTGSLGRIGRIIQTDKKRLEQHLKYLSSTLPEAVRQSKLVTRDNFEMNILSLTEFPGLPPELLTGILEVANERQGLKGVLFRAFGAGDASTHLHPAFRYLKENRIPIVVTTQAPNGNSNFRVNEPGQELERQDLAIPAHDMSIESMTAKLSWLLGQDLSYDEIKIRMVQDLRGEVNPSIE